MDKSLLMAYGFDKSAFPDLVERCKRLTLVGVFIERISSDPWVKDHYKVVQYPGYRSGIDTLTHDDLAPEFDYRKGTTFTLFEIKENKVYYEVYRI